MAHADGMANSLAATCSVPVVSIMQHTFQVFQAVLTPELPCKPIPSYRSYYFILAFEDPLMPFDLPSLQFRASKTCNFFLVQQNLGSYRIC